VLPTDLTVSAVVERHERFLTIEKRVSGVVVVTQPGAHIETDESPEQATIRGGLQESGCQFTVTGLLGVYLWIHPQTRQQYLRIVYTGKTSIASSMNTFAAYTGIPWAISGIEAKN
jgi:hypothetical protein